MTISRTIARPMLSSIFFVGAVSALKNSDKLAGKARKVTDKVVPTLKSRGVPLPQDPSTLVKLNAATQIVAAAALATGRAPRTSAVVLGASLVPTTVAGHAFWDETDPAMRQQQKLNFAKNVSVLGGLVLAALDTEGKPGVAWRARRVAKD
ncbi:MAG: DoxX family protein, partial [Myxococcales bacterium]